MINCIPFRKACTGFPEGAHPIIEKRALCHRYIQIEEQLLAQSVERFLRGLPKQRRTIFIRRYWYLYSVSQIAAQYGMSENKVALLLFRMRRQLKSHFEKEGIFL